MQLLLNMHPINKDILNRFIKTNIMKIKSILILNIILPVIMFSGFLNPEPVKNDIQGIWVLDGYEDNQTIYRKASAFKKDKPGFEFKSDGTMTKRQNVGWCGTPPVSYGNFDGKWEWTEDNNLRLEYEYWGGVDTIGFKVESIDNQIMKGNYYSISQ